MSATPASPIVRVGGKVCEITPTVFTVDGLSEFARLGDRVEFESNVGSSLGEIIRIRDTDVAVQPYDSCSDIGLGTTVWNRGALCVHPHKGWKGRILNALGEPIDDLGELPHGSPVDPRISRPLPPLVRAGVQCPIPTGIRAIDLFAPLCVGQRVGIFAGSGVGKSSLLAMLAQAPLYDAVVLALVGERSREVREFAYDKLGDALAKATLVVATSDESTALRKLAPLTAMAAAEFYRACGESVLLIVDSITRFAHACRDIALAAGEPPVARGYTPSVFSELPRLLERAGPGEFGQGSITGIFSVLVDGDDPNEPVSDCIRGTLDGHIVLSREIAEDGRFPAIDVLASISRLAETAWKPEQKSDVRQMKALLARFEESRELRMMGGYRAGADAELDRAIEIVPKLFEYLSQPFWESSSAEQPFDMLSHLLGDGSQTVSATVA